MRAILPHTGRKKWKFVDNLSIAGLVLVVLGIVGLWLGDFSYHNWIPAVNAGSIHLEAHADHRISVPTACGFFVLIVGVGLIAARLRRA